jgi:hypothetical protein
MVPSLLQKISQIMTKLMAQMNMDESIGLCYQHFIVLQRRIGGDDKISAYSDQPGRDQLSFPQARTQAD